jgi:hypothetical protein
MRKAYGIINYALAALWFINGFFCKILGWVPRHESIIAEILGEQHSDLFTILIGLAEILMAIWILSGYYPKLNAFIQILIISIMNILEWVMVPELLLWGRLNILWAALLVMLIYLNISVFYKKRLLLN